MSPFRQNRKAEALVFSVHPRQRSGRAQRWTDKRGWDWGGVSDKAQREDGRAEGPLTGWGVRQTGGWPHKKARGGGGGLWRRASALCPRIRLTDVPRALWTRSATPLLPLLSRSNRCCRFSASIRCRSWFSFCDNMTQAR